MTISTLHLDTRITQGSSPRPGRRQQTPSHTFTRGTRVTGPRKGKGERPNRRSERRPHAHALHSHSRSHSTTLTHIITPSSSHARHAESYPSLSPRESERAWASDPIRRMAKRYSGDVFHMSSRLRSCNCPSVRTRCLASAHQAGNLQYVRSILKIVRQTIRLWRGAQVWRRPGAGGKRM